MESRKIGSDNFHHVCDLSKIDIVITDHAPQSDFQQLLDHNDIEYGSQCLVAEHQCWYNNKIFLVIFN